LKISNNKSQNGCALLLALGMRQFSMMLLEQV